MPGLISLILPDSYFYTCFCCCCCCFCCCYCWYFSSDHILYVLYVEDSRTYVFTCPCVCLYIFIHAYKCQFGHFIALSSLISSYYSEHFSFCFCSFSVLSLETFFWRYQRIRGLLFAVCWHLKKYWNNAIINGRISFNGKYSAEIQFLRVQIFKFILNIVYSTDPVLSVWWTLFW